MGKSTFLNRVLGQKVAIVSHKPQTTRTRILGVLTRKSSQMVFLDTPGIHDAQGDRLNRAMVKTAYNACREVDAVLYFVDAREGVTREDWRILSRLPLGKASLVLAFNKIDRLSDRNLLLPKLKAAGEGPCAFSDAIPMSALNGDNVDHALDSLERLLSPGPRYFPEDQVTDQPERFIAAELVREKLFQSLREELPYALAVQVEHFQEEAGVLHFHARILVERDSQKGIVIGRGGSMLKKVGAEARMDLEKLLGSKVFLKLWVKVAPKWAANPNTLRDLGYLDGLDEEK